MKFYNKLEDLKPKERKFVLHTKPRYIECLNKKLKELKQVIPKGQILSFKRKMRAFYREDEKIRANAQKELENLIFGFFRNFKRGGYDGWPFITVATVSFFPGWDYYLSIDTAFLKKHKLLNKALNIKFYELKQEYINAQGVAKYILRNLDEEYVRQLESYLHELERPGVVYMLPPPRRSNIEKEYLNIRNKKKNTGYDYLDYRNFTDYKSKERKNLKLRWDNSLPFLWFEVLDSNEIQEDLKDSQEHNDKRAVKFYNKVIKILKKKPYYHTEDTIYVNQKDLKVMKALVLEIFKRHKVRAINENFLEFHLHIKFDEI